MLPALWRTPAVRATGTRLAAESVGRRIMIALFIVAYVMFWLVLIGMLAGCSWTAGGALWSTPPAIKGGLINAGSALIS